MKILSLNPVIRDGWIFKVSASSEGNILVSAFHTVFMYSHIRFFTSENSAKEWIENMVLTTKKLKIDGD